MIKLVKVLCHAHTKGIATRFRSFTAMTDNQTLLLLVIIIIIIIIIR